MHLENKEAVGLYDWAVNFVRLKSPTAASDIDRQQADSKFFRSLALVLICVCVFQGIQTEWPSFFVCLAVLLFSIFRFFKLRWRATNLVYTYFIALSSKLFDQEKAAEAERAPHNQRGR